MSDRNRYRHSVTAAERHDRPNEPVGGILADDMGLGKTLSAVALISASKDRAKQFSIEESIEQVSHGTLMPTKTTLVVVPSLLILEEWKKEIEKHTLPGALRIAKYHGHDRVTTARELLSFDIVLTTYGTVTTEHRRSYRGGREVLYFLRWFRVVLDEAHTIRSPRTAQCKAILALYARHHWCLTGTPVSNKVDDLAPLLRFCRVPLLQDATVFRDHVTKVTRKSFRQGCNALRQVLSPVCLRRTKVLLNLPQPRAVDHQITFSTAELERHAALFRHSRRCLDASVSGQHSAKSKHTILQAILQLRIFCNQGTFMSETQDISDEALFDPDEALTLLQEEGQSTCASCSAEVSIINQERDSSSGILGICSHVLCAVCRGTAIDDSDRSEDYKCPKCEQVFAEKILTGSNVLRSASNSISPHSSKLERMVEDLLSSQGKEKSIVFSVWRKTLDVAAQLCNDANIRYARIDGTVPQALRHQALEEFTTKPEISTLLMTLGTGALGLNLTAATRVHILEPQWNPAVEKQAIGRVVRMGQEKNATIIRYSVRNSVEQQIQTYQRRKMQLVAGGFGDGTGSHEYEAKILTATFFTEGKL
jgi:SWI/SNF-related matrix-associated actin-dependent regulator of chromatin subfamily A3